MYSSILPTFSHAFADTRWCRSQSHRYCVVVVAPFIHYCWHRLYILICSIFTCLFYVRRCSCSEKYGCFERLAFLFPLLPFLAGSDILYVFFPWWCACPGWVRRCAWFCGFRSYLGCLLATVTFLLAPPYCYYPWITKLREFWISFSHQAAKIIDITKQFEYIHCQIPPMVDRSCLSDFYAHSSECGISLSRTHVVLGCEMHSKLSSQATLNLTLA